MSLDLLQAVFNNEPPAALQTWLVSISKSYKLGPFDRRFQIPLVTGLKTSAYDAVEYLNG